MDDMKRILPIITALCLILMCFPAGMSAHGCSESGSAILDHTVSDNGDGTMTIESVTVRVAGTGAADLYTAVKDEEGILKKVIDMKIESEGESTLYPELTVGRGETAEAYLWRGMEPLTEAYELSPKETTAACEIYVAPDGSDETGDGTIDHPYASFEKARDVVRGVNKDMTGDITVYFRGGTYCIDDTITLGAEDSGTNGYKVRYMAYPGEEPVFSGGQKVTGWARDEEYPELYSAPLERSERLRQLYVNDQRAYMPSKAIQGQGGYGTYTITAGEGAYAWEDLSKSDGVKFSPSDLPADIKNPSDIEVQTRTTWQTQTVAVRGVESHDGFTVALFEQPYGAMAQELLWNTAYNPSKTNYVYNVFEFLDEPGEFYFDRSAQKLYYMPREGEDMESAEVYAPETETLLRIEGDDLTSHARDIVIDGLTFANSDWNLYEIDGSHGKTSTQASLSLTSTAANWHYSAYRSVDLTPAAVEITSADNIEFVNNTIKHTANDGLNIINDVTDSTFDGNVIYDTGATALSVGHPQHHFIGDKGSAELTGYKDPSNQHSDAEKYDTDTEGLCSGLMITNNYITDAGTVFYGTHGISVYYGTELKILHNHVENTPYSGISIGWGWGYMRGADLSDTNGSTSPAGETPNLQNNEIAYNRIINVLTALSDGGAIYTLGPMRGSSIHDNYISGVGSNGYHNRGIHLDEGTRYLDIYNNVINVDLSQAAVDAGSWGSNSNVYHKKGYNNIHDNHASTTLYTTTGSYETGTEIYDNHDNLSGYWNERGPIDIIRASGLSDGYLDRAAADPADLVLPANYSLTPESGITELSVPETIDGEIWLAPEGTTEFKESETVIKDENGKLAVPQIIGDYYVYIIKDGEISDVSDKCLTTKEVTVVTEVEPRDDVTGPFWAEDVTAVQGTGGDLETTGFGTAVAVDDDSAVFGITKLSQNIDDHIRVNGIDSGSGSKWDGYVEKTVTMERGGEHYIYILCFGAADRSYNVFVNGEQAAVTGAINTEGGTVYSSSNGLNILKERIWLDEGENTIRIRGNGAAPNFVAFALTPADPEIPSDGLRLWLSAEKGVMTDGGAVTKWVDISGAEHDAEADGAGCAPGYTVDDGTGTAVVSFDGADDMMRFPFTDELKDSDGMTVIIVSSSENSAAEDGGGGPLLCLGGGETADSFELTPYRDRIVMRMPGSGEVYTADKTYTGGGLSTTVMVKDGTTVELYDEDSVSIGTISDVPGSFGDILDASGYIGGDASGSRHFSGDIAEIIVYDKAVDLGVIQSVNTYLAEKYYPTEPRDIELTGGLDIWNGAQDEGIASAGAGSDNRYIETVFGQGGWQVGNTYAYGVEDDYRAAFDGDTSTYYDGPGAGYCGVEFREPQTVTRIGYQARKDTSRLDGAVLQGSNDGDSYTDIMTVSGSSTSEMRYAETGSSEAYKYIRLIRKDSNVLNICELELYTTKYPR